MSFSSWLEIVLFVFGRTRHCRGNTHKLKWFLSFRQLSTVFWSDHSPMRTVSFKFELRKFSNSKRTESTQISKLELKSNPRIQTFNFIHCYSRNNQTGSFQIVLICLFPNETIDLGHSHPCIGALFVGISWNKGQKACNKTEEGQL